MSELLTLDFWIKIIGIIAAIVASIKAIDEWRRATEQRKEELDLRQREFRHRQATFARDLTREIFGEKRSRAALKMLDWLEDEYEDDDGQKYKVSRVDIQHAMRKPTKELAFTDKELFIRTRFEALYDYLEQTQNLIDVGVINFDDIETVFRYYMERLLRPNICHFDFLKHYHYPKAEKFLQQFKGMKDRSTPN